MNAVKAPPGLRFDSQGLIPVIVQSNSGEVLMLAYASAEAIDEMVETGRTVFWSRSRKEIWRKGSSSGNWQQVLDISTDCDGDALLVTVIAHGPACHLGTNSCFESGSHEV